MSTTIKNILIGLLVVLNLATLGMLWYDRQEPVTTTTTETEEPNTVKPQNDLLAEELGFDQQQREQLQQLRREHHESMRSNEQKLFGLRKQLHQKIGEPNTTEEEVTMLSDSIGNILSSIERSVFTHFRDIRGLCTEEQAEHFDQVIFDLMKQMGPPGRGNRKGPPPGRP